jgi:hypothetical protein
MKTPASRPKTSTLMTMASSTGMPWARGKSAGHGTGHSEYAAISETL